MSSALFKNWINNQKPKVPVLKTTNQFYRNLEEALDVRRRDQALYVLNSNVWTSGPCIDFCSNDVLSLNSTGRLRIEYNRELAQHPNAQLGAGGSRLLDGNYSYIENLEKEVAEFHGTEAALILGSGCDANVAVFEAIPRPGDAIIYDELVHASIIDGMQQSFATHRVPFRHNDIDAFHEALVSVWDSQPLIKQGKRCVIIVVESIYSMEGDVCPLSELIQVAKEIFPKGNAQFIVDEAHSIGILGPNGSGLVCELGLEKEVAIRTHTFSKAFGSMGGAVLCNDTVKIAILNFSRSTVFTTAPAFPMVAAIRSGYALMGEPDTQKARENIQHLVKHFFKFLHSNPVWEEATDREILSIPVSEDYEGRPFVTQLAPIWTKERYGYWLSFHLGLSNFSAFPVIHPVVPKGTARIRLVIHASHTEAQVEGLAAAICEWAKEMIVIEDGGGNGKIPKAAAQVYSWMGESHVNGHTG